MQRLVLPEYLDALPADHADAEANRRELRAFNWYLGTNRWFERALQGVLRPGNNALEIGAGEGYLVQNLQARMEDHGFRHVNWTGLDRSDVFRRDPDGVHFVMEDLLHYDQYAAFDIVFGNLILHQFEEEALRELGARLAKGARALVFQETLRSELHYALCLLGTLPMGRVTRHDALVSIRAGFHGSELPELLGLDPDSWNWETSQTVRGAYRMVAVRK